MNLYYVELEMGTYMIRGRDEEEALELLAEHIEENYIEVYDFAILEENVKGESQVLLH